MAPSIVSCAECGRQARNAGRGLCHRCYERLRGRGELARYERVEKPFAEWMSLIDTSDPDSCWPWPGPIGENGYGQAGKTSAHRAAYAAMVGPVPDDVTIDHACCWRAGCPGGADCPHRSCVNWVRHLEPVSNTENQLRSPNTLGGKAVRTTHCPQGHPYDNANTRHYRGKRHCRACKSARDRIRRTANPRR